MNPLKIPIDTDFNLIFLQATIGDSPPLWFFLDTGVDVPCVLDAGVAKDLGLPVGESSTQPQPGGDVVVAPIGDTTICVAGQPVWTVAPLAFDFTPFAVYAGRPLHGILGHQAIADYVIELDYRAGMMTLYPPDDVPPSDTSVPLILGPTAVDAAAAIVAGTMTTLDGRELTSQFKLDTGGTGCVGLSHNFVRDNGLPPPGQPVLGQVGVAIGGTHEMFVFRIASFRLGDHVLHDMPISYDAPDNLPDRPYAGTLGGEILSRFRVVLDYPHHRMGLTPYPDTIDDRFTYDDMGMLLTLTPGAESIEIQAVFEDSPAAAAGLRPGDHIHAIDERPVTDIGLAGVFRMTRTGRPANHALRIERDSRMETIDIALRERL
ncbi:MAG TPA: aspartyl protease family protein [Candidatus Limnocylindrales bacterium]|nr:aspartyl protease family protein [Candidatus Limnocylindrales bacterium]